jgi:hypothetical protein
MPESLRILLDGKKVAFRPGDEIKGRAEWSLDAPPEKVEVHLCWFTRGKGTEDMEIVTTEVIENATPNGQRDFTFRAPDQPHSFSGQLISLIWALELVVEPAEQCERVEITIGPDAREIILPATVPDEKGAVLPAPRVI